MVVYINKMKHVPFYPLTIFSYTMRYNFCGKINKYSTNSKLRRICILSHLSSYLLKLRPHEKVAAQKKKIAARLYISKYQYYKKSLPLRIQFSKLAKICALRRRSIFSSFLQTFYFSSTVYEIVYVHT